MLPVVQAYNATKHDMTGFSPHYLFGRNPRLDVDAFLEIMYMYSHKQIKRREHFPN